MSYIIAEDFVENDIAVLESSSMHGNNQNAKFENRCIINE